MARKKAYKYTYDKVEKKDKDKQREEEIETEKTLKLFEQEFSEKENNKSQFVHGGTFDFSNKTKEIENTNYGKVYNMNNTDNLNLNLNDMNNNINKNNPMNEEYTNIKKVPLYGDKYNKMEINEDFNNKIIKSPSQNKFNNINNNYYNNINNFQQNLITNNEFSNTTLYIGNLSQNITEESLYGLFQKFGLIESVKILISKTEDFSRSKKNIGFVSFLNSEDAKRAKDEMQDSVIMSSILRIGWGKKAQNNNPLNPFNTNLLLNHLQNNLSSNRNKIQVKLPFDLKRKKLIDKVSKIVAEEGHIAERLIYDKNRDNPDYDFIINQYCDDNYYYRWRVFSFCQGDDEISYRKTPFVLFDSESIWEPPSMEKLDEKYTNNIVKTNIANKANNNSSNNFTSSETNFPLGNNLQNIDITDTSDTTDTNVNVSGDTNDTNLMCRDISLNKEANKFQNFFSDLLDKLTSKRKSITQSMVFAIDHPEKAKTFVRLIKHKIKNSQSHQYKIALLYLLNDILYNASCPVAQCAWVYTREIEVELPNIFEDLNNTYMSISGRLTAANMKELIFRVLSSWDQKGIFNYLFIIGLEATFLRRKNITFDERIKNCKDEYIVELLKEYENKLKNDCKYDKNSILQYAKVNGIGTDCDIQELVDKLIDLKEYSLVKERKNKAVGDIDFFKGHKKKEKPTHFDKDKYIKNEKKIEELNTEVIRLQNILSSLQKSYKLIDENNVDGLEIDKLEYDLFNLKTDISDIDGEDIDGEVLEDETPHQISNNNNDIVNEFKDDNIYNNIKVIEVDRVKNDLNNNMKMDLDDDIDGEPIDID